MSTDLGKSAPAPLPENDPTWLPRVAESEHGVMICGGTEFPIHSVTIVAGSADGTACKVVIESVYVRLPLGEFPGGPVEVFDTQGRLAWVCRRPVDPWMVVTGGAYNLRVELDLRRDADGISSWTRATGGEVS